MAELPNRFAVPCKCRENSSARCRMPDVTLLCIFVLLPPDYVSAVELHNVFLLNNVFSRIICPPTVQKEI